MNKKLIIYILGIVPFGLLYGVLKAHLNEIVFVLLAIAYILIVRWVAEKFG